MTIGRVARTYGVSDRPSLAASAMASTTASIDMGPVQPRTPNAMAATANEATSFVAGQTVTIREAGDEPGRQGGQNDEHDEAGDGLVDRIAEQALPERGVEN